MSHSSITNGAPIRVLIVEDSKTVRTHLMLLLQGVEGLELLEPAKDGQEAVDKALSLAPRVILLDLRLPVLDGIDVIRRVMAEQPCPIIVLSGELDRADIDYAYAAVQAGAVDVMRKPQGLNVEEQQRFRHELVRTLRVMSHVKVITSRDIIRRPTGPTFLEERLASVEVAAIGASTGGPGVLFELLSSLQAPLPFAILITQHTGEGFDRGLCEWLATTGHDVVLAGEAEQVQAGCVYVSRANTSLVVDERHCTRLAPPCAGVTPNINRMFMSVAEHYGPRALGVLLSGMGEDGAAGLHAMRNAGAWTIAQEESTCVVFGMPKAAIDAGAAAEILTPTKILQRLRQVKARSRDICSAE